MISLVLMTHASYVFCASNYRYLFEIPEPAQLYPTSVLELTKIVKSANLKNQKIAIVGANKSQGGQTLPNNSNGIRINLSKLNQLVALNVADKIVTVESGMTWSQLQRIICPYKLSIRAMQSYADFAIGAALAVNVHGQDLLNNPIIKSVRAFKLLNSEGQIINVSRVENSELFGLVIGGYGLFGIITEVTLELTDNILLERQVANVSCHEFVNYFTKHIQNDPSLDFYSARFDLKQETFLDNIIIVSYKRISPNAQHSLVDMENDSLKSKVINKVARYGLLAISNWDALKNIRFSIEQMYFKSGVTLTRNYFMSFPLDSLPQDTSEYMYVLQEYFIPYAQVNEFIGALKKHTKECNINLLNVTARHVNADNESFLSYSPVESCAFVLYIKVKKSNRNYQDVANYGTSLIDEAIKMGGKYYLPYQLLGSKDQLYAIYPQMEKLVNLKKLYDPKELFSNQLYSRYA